MSGKGKKRADGRDPLIARPVPLPPNHRTHFKAARRDRKHKRAGALRAYLRHTSKEPAPRGGNNRGSSYDAPERHPGSQKALLLSATGASRTARSLSTLEASFPPSGGRFPCPPSPTAARAGLPRTPEPPRAPPARLPRSPFPGPRRARPPRPHAATAAAAAAAGLACLPGPRPGPSPASSPPPTPPPRGPRPPHLAPLPAARARVLPPRPLPLGNPGPLLSTRSSQNGGASFLLGNLRPPPPAPRRRRRPAPRGPRPAPAPAAPARAPPPAGPAPAPRHRLRRPYPRRRRSRRSRRRAELPRASPLARARRPALPSSLPPGRAAWRPSRLLLPRARWREPGRRRCTSRGLAAPAEAPFGKVGGSPRGPGRRDGEARVSGVGAAGGSRPTAGGAAVAKGPPSPCPQSGRGGAATREELLLPDPGRAPPAGALRTEALT